MRSVFSAPLHILRDADVCTACGLCSRVCTTGKITASAAGSPVIREDALCISCGQCIAVCPVRCLSTDTAGFSLPQDADAYRSGIDADLLSRYLMSRRSVRVWKDRPVPREVLMQLVAVAAYAPSACNVHPVKWVVVADPAKVREFARASVAFLKTLPASHPLAGVAGMLLAGAAEGGDPVCRNAPAVLIAATDADQEFGLIDSVIALSAIDTYASSLGLGTCWVGYVMILLQLSPELGKIFGIPEGWVPQYAMLAGYPGVSFTQVPPREVPEVVWR